MIVCGVMANYSTTTDAIVKCIEDTHNCNFEVVSLSDTEKCELRELISMEVKTVVNFDIIDHNHLFCEDLQKRNSQAGWRSGNKYMRNKR